MMFACVTSGLAIAGHYTAAIRHTANTSVKGKSLDITMSNVKCPNEKSFQCQNVTLWYYQTHCRHICCLVKDNQKFQISPFWSLNNIFTTFLFVIGHNQNSFHRPRNIPLIYLLSSLFPPLFFCLGQLPCLQSLFLI